MNEINTKTSWWNLSDRQLGILGEVCIGGLLGTAIVCVLIFAAKG